MYVVVAAVVAGLLGGIYGLVPALGQPVFEITASLTYLLFAGGNRTPLLAHHDDYSNRPWGLTESGAHPLNAAAGRKKRTIAAIA
jgi:hypothetical protein